MALANASLLPGRFITCGTRGEADATWEFCHGLLRIEAGVKCQLSHSIGGTSRKEPWHELTALAGTHECHGRHVQAVTYLPR